MILTGATTVAGQSTSRSVCCVVEGSKHYVTQAELARLSRQLQQALEPASITKPLRVVLPQWVQSGEFLYSLAYVRREPMTEPVTEYSFALRVLRLAQFLSNADLLRHSVTELILPLVSPANITQALSDACRFRKTAKGEDSRPAAELFYSGCIQFLGRHMLDLQESSAQLGFVAKLRNEVGEESIGQIVEEGFESAYGLAVTGYEENKVAELIDAHMKTLGESSVVGLFTKKLKAMLEHALKETKARNGAHELLWNPRGDLKAEQKSASIERGGEVWHLLFRRDERASKYQVQLAKGAGEDAVSRTRKRVPTLRLMERTFSSEATRLARSVVSTPMGREHSTSFKGFGRGKTPIPAHLGLRTMSRRPSTRPARCMSSYNDTSRDSALGESVGPQALAKCIKLSLEATNAINLNATGSSKNSLCKVMCMVSYIEMGQQDGEARMNVHYINTQDKVLVVKERSTKELDRRDRTVPVRASLFHSFAVSALLEHIVSTLDEAARDRSVAGLSQHQLMFVLGSARRNGVTEDTLCDAVWVWAEQNVNKCPAERIAAVVRRVNWRAVSKDRVEQLASQPLYQKLGLRLVEPVGETPVESTTPKPKSTQHARIP